MSAPTATVALFLQVFRVEASKAFLLPWTSLSTTPPGTLLAYLAIAFILTTAIRRLVRHRARFSPKSYTQRYSTSSIPPEYDVIVVGASIAGPPLAVLLAKQGRRVLVIEKSLQRPDRIVGELMQPKGMRLLRQMGMEDCATKVGVPCSGYVAQFEGEWVQLPFPSGLSSVSFHFGDFVQELRKKMLTAAKDGGMPGSITVVEGTAHQLLSDDPKDDTSIVRGVQYRRTIPLPDGTSRYEECSATAHLVVFCDGFGSPFRPASFRRLPVHSHFVGVILQIPEMPFETRGHVILARHGPVLSYRLDPNEVRILVDYHATPALLTQQELLKWLEEEIKPQLPPAMQGPLSEALKDPRGVRSMPISHFSPIFPKRRGCVGIGDHGNQRHPLTGGGMSCALSDVQSLVEHLAPLPSLGDSKATHDVILTFLRSRYRNTSAINILSWALHGVFCGPQVMRKACFDYFLCGGQCVAGPMALLSGVEPRVAVLIYHYVRVMVYGAWMVIFGAKFSLWRGLTFFLSPLRIYEAIHVLVLGIRIFVPLLFKEFLLAARVLDPTK